MSILYARISGVAVAGMREEREGGKDGPAGDVLRLHVSVLHVEGVRPQHPYRPV